jgi:hypothetical protein
MTMTATGEPSRLAVEVRFDAEPIEGRVSEDGGLNRPFSGWLGLMAAIEAARPSERRPPDDRNGGSR